MRGERPAIPELERRGTVVGGYALGELLGVGGMGVVYAANQRSLDRTVAVKVPRPELVADAAVRRRFETEAYAGSRINHRNVVRVLDYGDADGVPYLVMEHVCGPRLGHLVFEQGPMSVLRASELIHQLLGGLEDAHANGIIHADVKSDNVLVETLRDGSARPRLIDFGIARFVGDLSPSEPPDGECVVSGTPEYLAPELIRGEPPTFASDLYAVGVILYELIAGETPFAAESSALTMRRHLEDKPVPLSWRCPDRGVGAAFDDVMSRALAKRVSSRFATAAEFAGALLAAIAGDAGRTRTGPRPAMLPDAFSTATTTASICIDGVTRPRMSVPRTRTGGRPLAQLRDAVTTALERGIGDEIAVAYLDLAHVLVDRHRLAAAIAELEDGVALLSASTTASRSSSLWRLLLSLAALYDGHGDRARARIATRSARDHAERAGSTVGRERADQLWTRLARDSGAASNSGARKPRAW